MLATIRQDVVFAIRLLRQSPAFAGAAILTIALAVGVNTAVFSVVNAFIMRPLSVREADRLIVLATSRPPARAFNGVSYRDLEDYREATRDVFEDIAGYNVGFLGLRLDDGPAERVLVTSVTGNYFSLLDLQPAVGRLFHADEGGPGRVDAIVVLGYGTWQKRFGGDPAIAGRIVRVNGKPCTVVGVAPRGFSGAFAFAESELYLPLNWASASALDDRGSRWLHALGRLRPGVTQARAQTTMDTVSGRLAREHPEENDGVAVTVIPERLARPIEDAARSSALVATTMLGLAALVVLVGGVNVANLLLARAVERQRELAIRAAVGASRARLIRQIATESVLLGCVGGIAGVLFAAWIGRLLESVRVPGDLPVRFDFHFDSRVLAYSAAVVLITASIAGAVPAVRASGVDVVRLLRQSARGSRESGKLRVRSILVAAEIAAALVLLVATTLFVRSLRAAEGIDLGFQPDRVLNVHMDVGQLGYSESQGRTFFTELERDVRAIPGVLNSAFAFVAPLGYVRVRSAVDAEGRPVRAADRVEAGFNLVDGGYFDTMGIRLERGRAFTDDDRERSQAVAVVNRRLAERLWPGVDPIGRRFSRSGAGGPWLEVIGVTYTGKYHYVFEEPRPFFYLPIAQHYTGLRVLHVRTALAPEQMAPAVERTIRQLEPDLALYDVQSMKRALGGGFGFFLVRVGALAGGVFGALGLGLALVGVYGLAAYTAGQRRHELGVRIALGASPGDIRRLLLRDGIILVTVGTSTGLAGAAAVSVAIRSVLFGGPALDIRAFAAAAAVLASAAVLGCGIPAWRAARLDPAASLRLE